MCTHLFSALVGYRQRLASITMTEEKKIESVRFGQLIRKALDAYRIKKGDKRASLRDLSPEIGISVAMLYKYDSGQVGDMREISVSRWISLARLLDCTVEDCLHYCETGEWMPKRSEDEADFPLADLECIRRALMDLTRRVEAAIPDRSVNPNAAVIERLEAIEKTLGLPENVLPMMLAGYGVSGDELDGVYRGKKVPPQLLRALEHLEAPFLSMSAS